MDLSAPPSQGLLFLLASCAANNQQAARLSALATVGGRGSSSRRFQWAASGHVPLAAAKSAFLSLHLNESLVL